MYLVVLAVFVVLFTPRTALAATHISRLQIPLHKSSVIVEKKDGAITKKILVSDYLSSTKAVISEKGTVSTAPSYYPYGSSIAQVSLSEANRQYTSQRKVSDESTIYNYNARYYNPTTAIFIQPDSIEGPTRYSYVAGNPIMGNDPSGHQCESGFGKRCQGFLSQQINLNGVPAPDYGANEEFPIEAVGFMANLMEFHPAVAAFAGAYEAVSGKSFPEGESIGLFRRTLGAGLASLGIPQLGNIAGGVVNNAVQTTRVNRLGGRALLAAKTEGEAVNVLRSLDTGADIIGVSKAQFSIYEKEGFEGLLNVTDNEKWALMNLKARPDEAGLYQFRQPEVPNGSISYYNSTPETLRIMRHEGIHLLQDYGGHGFTKIVSKSFEDLSRKERALLFDVENMAYGATEKGTAFYQLNRVFSSLGPYAEYRYLMQSYDDTFNSFSRASPLQGFNRDQ